MSPLTVIPLLHKELQGKWEFEKEFPIQQEVIPKMLNGKDIVAISPTGTGKTLAYVLPILHLTDGTKKATQALILAPSQELAMQIVGVIREWTSNLPTTVTSLIGGANIARQMEKLKKKPTIVVGTPGRVLELIQKNKLKMNEVRHIILDEGDRLLSREHRDGIKKIIGYAKQDVQLVLVSATLNEEIEIVADRIMKEPVRIFIKQEQIPQQGHVIHTFIRVEARRKIDLLRKISNLQGVKALAFVNRLDQAFLKEMKLQKKSDKIQALHSEKRKDERKRVLDSFRKGETSVLIATDLAARGLDIPGITHVIHIDCPLSTEEYLHRSGRTGRAGADGVVLTMLAGQEEKMYKQIVKKLQIQPIEKVWKNGRLVEI